MFLERLRKCYRLFLLLAVVLFFIKETTFVFRKVWARFRIFQASQFSYSEDLKQFSVIAPLLAAKQVIPADATVTVLREEDAWDLEKVCMRFYLYPLRISENGSYVIDWENIMGRPPPGWTPRRLSWGKMVYAKPGFSFLSPPVRPKSLPLTGVVVFMLCYLAAHVLTGAGLLRLLNVFKKNWGVAAWGASFLLGYLVLTLCIWGYLLMGGILSRSAVLLLWGTMIFLATIILYIRRDGTLRDSLFKIVSIRPRMRAFFWPLVFTLTVAGIFGMAISSNVLDWDGMSHWVMKAKVVYHERHLVFHSTHLNEYPWLWPLNLAVQFVLSGGMYGYLAQWTSGIFFLVFVTQIMSGMEAIGIKKTWIYLSGLFYILLLFHCGPGWDDCHFIAANAENILLAYLAGMVSFILWWMRERRNSAFIMGAIGMAVGLSLSKLEGGVQVLFVFLSLILLNKSMGLSTKDKKFLSWFLLILLLPLSWVLFVKWHECGATWSHFHSGVTTGKIFLIFNLIPQYVLFNKVFSVFALILFPLVIYRGFNHMRVEEKFLLFFLSC